jgi:hypothetical protein
MAKNMQDESFLMHEKEGKRKETLFCGGWIRRLVFWGPGAT